MTPPAELPQLDELPTPFAGRYDISQRLGAGESSVVYRARDRVTGHDIALKVLDPRLSWDRQALVRLKREAIVSRRVPHAGIVRVHDFVTDGDHAAIVEELITGESLDSVLAREGALPVARAVGVAGAILDALASCHKHGVLHRDLKPSNVLLEREDRVRLIDFGIAKVGQLTTVTHTGAIFGTPGYQAPELLRGERLDLRADLYGVGLLLYEMLTGEPAFAGSYAVATARQLSGPPPDPSAIRSNLNPALAAVVRALLEPEPERRPSDALEVLGILEDFHVDRTVVVTGLECRECGQRSRSLIPFCPRCGLRKAITMTPGNYFVRNLRHEEKGGLRAPSP